MCIDRRWESGAEHCLNPRQSDRRCGWPTTVLTAPDNSDFEIYIHQLKCICNLGFFPIILWRALLLRLYFINALEFLRLGFWANTWCILWIFSFCRLLSGWLNFHSGFVIESFKCWYVLRMLKLPIVIVHTFYTVDISNVHIICITRFTK